MKTKMLRHPKGRKQALIQRARPGSIPPDAWDDIPIRNNNVWVYAKNLYPKTKKYSEFRDKFKAKFPKYTESEVKKLFYLYKESWENRSGIRSIYLY